MDWIVSFRFHWGEAIVYKSLQYLPLALFGFSATAVLVQALVGTAIGHLNHANLDLGHGRWRYLLNSPRMHLWHHSAEGPRLGFAGDATLPRGFFGLTAWPALRLHPGAP
jgi:sterol desaturase/sphingolipid hydroxylase (fatty acid hydroxylase superfamily)